MKIDILAKQGKYEQALDLYRNYSAMLGRYQKNLLSQDLLFSDKRHQLEMSNLIEIHKRDRIIGGTLCSILGLVILAGWLYYRAYRSKSTRILTEKANLTLKLEQENLHKEKENAILERNKKILEAEILEKEKKQLEAEHRLHELETSNLKLEIAQLESEHEKFKKLQKDLLELATPIQHAIKDRLELLNGLLAKEISNNESYAKPYSKWIETIHNDKKKFMESTRLAFTASHPKFMDYLKEHGLTTDEINFLCLYAIGLRRKEIGEYLQIKRHYITSHEIRQKLGIGEHDTNLGIYIRRLIKSFE